MRSGARPVQNGIAVFSGIPYAAPSFGPAAAGSWTPALGKSAPFPDQARDGLRLSLTGAGRLTSSITAVAAVVVTPVGRWAGTGRALPTPALGLVIIGLSGLATSVFVDTTWQLFLSRLLEAVGYVAIMVAGPVLPAHERGEDLRKWALALWGCAFRPDSPPRRRVV